MDLNEARRIKPQDAFVSNGFGVYYNEKGDYDRAITELNEAIRLWPQFFFAYRNRGVSYEKKGDLARALADFRVALSFDPDKKFVAGREAAEGIQRIEQKLVAIAAPTPHISPPLVSSLPAMGGRRVALIVGNGAYQNVARLDNPVNDAKLMADTLRGLGFTLVGGGAQINLDKAGLDSAVQRFSTQIQGADVSLFYYAGHGVQVRGANYLVPVGANPTREADVDFQMVDIALVLRQMEGSGAKLNLVILDACRNNPFGGRGLRATEGGLAQMRAPSGTMISYATQPGAVAQDGSEGNSPFTRALAQTMRRPGLNIFQTFNEVGLAVQRSTGGAQQPWVSSSPIDGDFYFAGPAGSASQQRGAPEQ
jgi:hypothetical protein